MPPRHGFLIHTPNGKHLSDIYPRTIAIELNRLNDRVKELEEELMDAKNKYAVLVADVVLNEDVAERNKQLEAAIRTTLETNRHLADGDVCTLATLKKVVPDWT